MDKTLDQTQQRVKTEREREIGRQIEGVLALHKPKQLEPQQHSRYTLKSYEKKSNKILELKTT